MQKHCRALPLALLAVLLVPSPLFAQLYSFETEFLKLVYYDKAHAYLVPHLARSFENSLRFHRSLFDYTPSEKIIILLHDFGDYGHGGTSTVPWNYMTIGLEPFDYVYETMPANERMNWLMHHELVHVVATDKASGADTLFRRLFRGKVAPTAENPTSMFYSFLTSPRWYSPRWYHEGIAVFLETWMAGGLGRVLGGYDEMVFRTMVLENSYFYDIVGLESEGTTIDFQVGQNSYLYGTRFATYLATQYGPEKLIQWFNRNRESKGYFSSQFRAIYGISLDDAWSNWIAWERQWQQANFARIRQYPTTQYKDLLRRPVGSVSRSFYNTRNNKLYSAINYPGEGAQIVVIDITDGSRRKICDVPSPALYYVTSLAYDASLEKLFFTTDNVRGWRDLNEVDIATGRTRQLLKDCRVGDLVFHPVDKSIWGVQHHNGISSLVKIPVPYTEGWNTILALPYGKDIFDVDISPDGRTLCASMIEVNGRQQLIRLEVEKLLRGISTYDVLHEFENNGPENFVFSKDGRYLYGTSYFTGVSNIFRYDLENKKIEAITNAETGFFRPIQISEDSLLAFRYTAKGFTPVVLRIGVREDVSAIRYLGQEVVEKYPVVTKWMVGSPAKIKLEEITTYQGEYQPLKSVRLASLYPMVEGYKDLQAYGMRFNFADPVGLHGLDLTASYTPNGDISQKERFHLRLNYDHWPWKFRATYNGADFYDLFGPTKTSRKGASLGARYQGYIINERPKTLEYSFNVNGFVGLDRLPDYQNIVAPFDKLLTFGARLDYKYLRRTLGAVDVEKGVQWGLRLNNNLVNAENFPRILGHLDYGIPLPITHSSLWLRGSAGQSFGNREQPFANFFFGGFGNNYVDYQESRRYREFYSFPGTKLNEIGGTNYGKLMAEWTLPPVRFRRLGFPALYANWAQLDLFTSALVTNVGSAPFRRSLVNAGGQLDLKLVMFSNLESTLSLGYASALGKDRPSTREFMISLKILR